MNDQAIYANYFSAKYWLSGSLFLKDYARFLYIYARFLHIYAVSTIDILSTFSLSAMKTNTVQSFA